MKKLKLTAMTLTAALALTACGSTAASTPNVKAPTIKAIEEWLYHERLISMERFPKKGFYYVPTPAGVDAGLRSVDRVTASGMPYSVLDYTPDAQRLIVEHFIKMKPEENSST